jgi:GDP-4-dehydro-6-deoxy-D-mannose reductase
MDANVSPNISHIRSSLHLHTANILDAPTIKSLITEIRPARVIHLAGQAFVPTSLQDPIGTFQANIFGGLSVLEAVRGLMSSGAGSCPVLIVSTGEVYGKVKSPDLLPIGEEVPLDPNNPYAASKASIDLLARQYAAHFGVDVTIVRPFNHVGPRQSPVFVCSEFGKQFAEIATGMRPPVIRAGNLEARRDFTDVRDVVRAYWLLFDRRSSDIVFNVCSGRAVQIVEILSLFKEISGLNVEVVAAQERLRSYDVPLVVGNYERLHRATGWTPTIPLRQTLADVFSYWRSHVSLTGSRQTIPR